MKTSKIFIIGLYANDEDIGEITHGTAELWNKHQARCSNMALIHFDCSAVGMMSTTFESSKLVPKTVFTKGSVESDDGDYDIGIYLMAHGYDFHTPTRVCRFTPSMLADFFQDLGFTAIRKLCLVVCRGASSRESKTVIVDNVVKGEFFLAHLCAELSSRNTAKGTAINPMIAGWETYVTVASKATDAERVRKTRSTTWSADELIPHYGKKIAGRDTRNRGFVRDPDDGNKAVERRQAEKMVVMWKGGNIMKVPLKEWTDK